MAKKSFDYSVKKDLKKIGAIEYDLRSPLTKWQKERIRGLWREHRHYINNPNAYATPIVKAKTKKILKASGYSVTPHGRAIIPLREYEKVKISKKATLEYEKKGSKSTVFLNDGKTTFLEKLKSLIGKPLANNQMVTAAIGDHSPFAKRFLSYEELFYYLKDEFEPNDEDEDPDLIWPIMGIVTITPEGRHKQTLRTKGTPVKTRTNRRRKK